MLTTAGANVWRSVLKYIQDGDTLNTNNFLQVAQDIADCLVYLKGQVEAKRLFNVPNAATASLNWTDDGNLFQYTALSQDIAITLEETPTPPTGAIMEFVKNVAGSYTCTYKNGIGATICTNFADNTVAHAVAFYFDGTHWKRLRWCDGQAASGLGQ